MRPGYARKGRDTVSDTLLQAMTNDDLVGEKAKRETIHIDLTKAGCGFDGLCAQSLALARITGRSVSGIEFLRAADDIAEIRLRVSKQGLFPSTIERQIALGETQELPYGGTLCLERLDTTPKSMSARLRFTADT